MLQIHLQLISVYNLIRHIFMKNLFVATLVFLMMMGLNTQTCPQNCTTCASSTSCSACQTGYFLVNSASCRPCPPGCTDCALGPNTTVICSNCAAPAQLNSNGQCFLCDPICQTCSNFPNNCTSCRDGLELQANANTSTCAGNPNCTFPNCGECGPDSANRTVCIRCLDGFFLYRGKCVPCLFSCSACSLDFPAVWTVVQQFWDGLIRQTFNITTPTPPPNSLPPFMNNLDWGTNSEQTNGNWFEAFINFNTFGRYWFSQNLTEFDVLRQGAQLIQSLQNITNPLDIQRAIFQKIKNSTRKNFTAEEISKLKGSTVAAMTNCSACIDSFDLPTTPPFATCRRCPLKCLSCSSGTCTLCQRGFIPDVGGACVPCTAPCAQCGNTPSNCIACFPPASLSAGSCVICSEPCATCTSSNISQCVTCKRPFSLTPGASGCFRCEQDLCIECAQSNTSICLGCSNGSTLIDGRCQMCPGNCASCSPPNNTIPGVCFQCRAGFILTPNGTCAPCPPGCVQCAPNTTATNFSVVCVSCQAGAYLNISTAICQRCREGCSVCLSFQNCLVYNSGVIVINNVTVRCRLGCKVCDSTNPDQCTECEQRFILDTGVCKSCETGCKVCSSQTVCTTCLDNLILQTGNCLMCQGNCRTCSSSNLTSCLTCKRGTVLVGTDCVRNCNIGCLECDPSNSSICINCNQGHALSQTGQCIKCLGSCSGSCDPRNISICLSCVDGFELKDNQCVRCSPGCVTCTNSQCSLCAVGFKLTQTSSGSFICKQKCRAPCLECQGDTCSACQAGFNLTNNRCQVDLSCNPNCPFCPIGTQKLSDGSCSPCPANCSSCASGVCVQCNEGKFLSSGTCEPCPAQCRTCFNNDSCDRCSPGFVKEIVSMSTGVADAVYSDKCIACNPICRTCVVQPDRCTSCNEGFRLMSFRCAGMYTVVYQYELNIDYALFLANSEGQNFIQVISNMTGVSVQDNFINFVREGSTVIGGTLSASNQAGASSAQASLGSSVSGYTVLSSSATVYYGDSPYTPEQTKSSVNVGLIVGVVVGGVVFIAIIAFIIYKIKAKAAAKTMETDQGTMGQFGNNENVPSYGQQGKLNNFDKVTY